MSELKRLAAAKAMDFVEDGMIVGVGTGSTVACFIDALAAWKDRIAGAVSSSEQSTAQLKSHGIEVIDLNSAGPLSLYVDGADECDPRKCLIKGGGGALTREKIIAEASERFVCIIDPAAMERELNQIPGVVCTGLFARRPADVVIVGGEPPLVL
jgi:ribose 5-phosphate isomerase A